MHFTSFVTLVGASLFAVGVQAGGFSSTCKDIKLDGNHLLTATCTRVKGGPTTNTIDLNSCIVNRNGKLKCENNGNFDYSCKQCKLSGANMHCTCAATGGADINLNDCISNLDGKLSCP